MKKTFIILFLLFSFPVRAEVLFNADEPIIDNLSVLEMSNTFSEIYNKLDSVKWGGKDIRIAIESIENVVPNTKIAATDSRVMVLSKDTIIGNWPRPIDGNWEEFAQITTAIILKLREVDKTLGNMKEPSIYKSVVNAIMKGINENGKYIYSQKELENNDPYVLTSLGIGGVRTNKGDYVINTIFKGSSADSAGIDMGDVLISVNNVALRNLSDMEVLGLFNGFSSGTIKIKAIETDGKEKNLTIRRASIVTLDADIVMLNGEKNILQIIVHKISDNSVDIVSEALYKYNGKFDSVYLDLRATVGDDERAMAKFAGLFLGAVPVARIVTDADKDIEIVPGGDAFMDKPIMVAVSNATSGTAEALAFAFYENNIGVIIGIPTAGRARLATKLGLSNGGRLELLNREIKTGKNRTIHGRGFFPLVCLSNIRTSEQKDVFLVNVKNHEWNMQDFNKDENVSPETVKKGCPNIKSGKDEDEVSIAVAMDILMNEEVYQRLGRGLSKL